MTSRTSPDRADRAGGQASSDRRAARKGEVRLDTLAALRFCGLGLDYTRMTELRRRALCAHGETSR